MAHASHPAPRSPGRCSECGGTELTTDFRASGLCVLCLEPAFACGAIADALVEAVAADDRENVVRYAEALRLHFRYRMADPGWADGSFVIDDAEVTIRQQVAALIAAERTAR